MDINIIEFDDTEIEEYKFYRYNSPISICKIDINEIVVSHKLPFSKQDFKYFIGYKDVQKLERFAYSSQKWVHIEVLIKTTMYFMIKEENIFDKYNEICEKVSTTIKKL